MPFECPCPSHERIAQPRPKVPHAITRIRQALAELPLISGKNSLARPAEFARWLGRSDSLVRNVENRVVPCSANLAKRIAEKTGVSLDWLLSDPPVDSVIVDQKGAVWDPAVWLHPLVVGPYDFRRAAEIAPRAFSALVLAFLEILTRQEVVTADHLLLSKLMEAIKEANALANPEFKAAVDELLTKPDLSDARELWGLVRIQSRQVN